MSIDKTDETQDTPEVVKWKEGDKMNGPKGFDVRGLPGCIAIHGVRELGMIEIAIFETDVAFPHRAERNRDEQWTVKVIGMGENGPMSGYKTRSQAVKASFLPSGWSKKCAKLAEKLRKDKEKAAAEKQKAAESTTEAAEASPEA